MIEAKNFWSALGRRPIGVSVVTALGAEGPAGFLALSASHVTADPPTMLVSIDDKTSALSAVLHARHFAVNYLPAGADSVAEAFGGRGGLSGAARFALEQWDALETGAPVFKGAVAAMDCKLATTFRHGSTTIAVGTIIAVRTADAPALVFSRGRYISL